MNSSFEATVARLSRVLAAGGAVVALAGTPLLAQQQQQASTGGRWQGWIGCWTAATDPSLAIPLTNAPLVCVTPTSDVNVVDVATVADGKIVSRDRIDASGRELPVDVKDCSGTKSGRWSADGRRVFLKASTVCAGTPLTTSGILALTPTGEWLDIQSSQAGGGSSMRVIRYADAGMPASVPAELSSVLDAREVSTHAARVAAGAPVGRAAVIEATQQADTSVVAAWLLERHQPFRLDARELVSLADAGVPASITDAMIAVSNPKVFAVGRPSAVRNDDIAGRRIYVTLDRYDPFGFGYGRYGYSGYGYNGYGYNGYGYNGYTGLTGGYGYPGYYTGAPVIIVNNGQTNSSGTGETRGHMVKGRGFVPDASTTSTSSAAAARSSGSTSSGSSGTSGSSSSGSSAGQSSSQGSERTAKPRP